MQPGNNPGQWKQVLDSDKAGAATNAEDFTKQFMSQMYGGGAGQQPQQASQGTLRKSKPVVIQACLFKFHIILRQLT